MRPRLPRLLRLGLPAVAVLALGLAGCGDPASAVPDAQPTPSVSATPSSPAAPSTAAAPQGPARQVAGAAGSTGSDGLTVRYLAGDGRVTTVRVEDFRR